MLIFFGWVAVMQLGLSGLAQTSDESLTIRGGAIFFDRPEFDSVVLVEFPFALQRQEYEFFKPDSSGGEWFARIFAQITLFGVNGIAVDSANTYFSALVATKLEAEVVEYTLFNSLVLVLPAGIFSARLTVIDVVSKRQGEFFYDRLIVEPPKKDRLALGAKCFAYQISYVGDSVRTVGVPKNGYEVFCNPLGVFSTTDTAVFLYAELYNLEYSSDQPSDYELSFAVLDDQGKLVHQLGSWVRPKPGRSAVVVESFDIGGWQPGSYLLQVTATDHSAGSEVSHEMLLMIVAPTTPEEMRASLAQGDPSIDLDLGTALALVKNILTPEEAKTLKGLSEDGQQTFLDQYWLEKDSDPATVIIENRLERYRRYLFANHEFSQNEASDDGWKTDRGRIFMTFGSWDQIDDNQHPTSGYPYQIWNYFTFKRGAIFIFQDDGNLGDYRLVHSNVEGEIFDKDWDEAIKSGMLNIQ